ncbi:hypothetical protein [Streptomyces sp. NPDC046197]|uniref:hypothetical protein n=1 Tax=Streptomyces sp. NPDC046197 TaxID=3154337 RepID=UPI0033DE9EDE
MDPASLSLLAVTLLATKFGEGLAVQAGQNAWAKVQGVTQAVRERLSRSEPQREALAQLDASPEDQDRRAAVVAHLRHELESDEEFAATIEDLVASADRDPGARTLIATARDNAKQAVIGRDNLGPITFS